MKEDILILMKPLLAVLLIGVLQGIPPLIGPLIPDGNGIVTGVVRRADTGQAIPDALVSAAAAGESAERALSRAVVTDRNGRFTIRNVPPGMYTVVVQRDGFFSPNAETAESIQTGSLVAVFEGQTSDVATLELIPGAAISGRIAGSDRLPLASATVEALRASYVRGRLTFTPVKSTLTDDLGAYRLFWLPPGEYYIRSRYRTTTKDRPERYEWIFFPGIAEEDAAPPVFLSTGAEISGTDILITTTPVRGFTLSGRVTSSSEEDAEKRITAVHVVPRDRRVLLADADADLFHNHAADPSNGRFEVRDVPPGAYDVFLVRRDGGRVQSARIAINVENRDIENLTGVFDPPTSVSGQVTWDGEGPGDRLPRSPILFRRLDEIPPLAGMDATVTPDARTGEFTLALQPGRYAVRPAPALSASNGYIADVKQGEKSVFDAGLTISPESKEPFVVELRSRSGTVSGTAIDSARLRPLAHATVALVPESSRRQNSALYWHGKSGSDGAFRFVGVPAGNYKLFAWPSAPTGAWENAAFLQRYEERGLVLTVEEGVEKKVQVNVIR